MKTNVEKLAEDLRTELSEIREILTVIGCMRTDIICEDILLGVGNIADNLVEKIRKMEASLYQIEEEDTDDTL